MEVGCEVEKDSQKLDEICKWIAYYGYSVGYRMWDVGMVILGDLEIGVILADEVCSVEPVLAKVQMN